MCTSKVRGECMFFLKCWGVGFSNGPQIGTLDRNKNFELWKLIEKDYGEIHSKEREN